MKKIRKKRAVLTIEAALSVPLFLIVMTSLIMFANIYYVRERIDAAVYEEAKKIAVLSYGQNTYGVGGIEASISERLGDRFLSSGVIKGGTSGLNYSDTDLSNPEIAVISVRYSCVLPFGLSVVASIVADGMQFESKAVAHTWTGYRNGLSSYSDLSEYVYMTKNGEVYHRNRECTHIRLHIKSVSKNELTNIRNSSGAKYKKCEYCRPKSADTRLYVAEDGDRYHNTLSCMGLRRTVIRVRLSDIAGVRQCSRCGY